MLLEQRRRPVWPRKFIIDLMWSWSRLRSAAADARVKVGASVAAALRAARAVSWQPQRLRLLLRLLLAVMLWLVHGYDGRNRGAATNNIVVAEIVKLY
jgi:hypothetical protein